MIMARESPQHPMNGGLEIWMSSLDLCESNRVANPDDYTVHEDITPH